MSKQKSKSTKTTPDAVKAAPVVPAAPAVVSGAAKSTPVTENPIEFDADGNPLKVRRSIVPNRFKTKYKAHGGTCGDDMALELKAATTTMNADKRPCLDLPAIKAIAEANGINWRPYEGLNNGQWRMNIGNKLRGKLAQGEDVVVGKRTFKAEDWTPPVKATKEKKAA